MRVPGLNKQRANFLWNVREYQTLLSAHVSSRQQIPSLHWAAVWISCEYVACFPPLLQFLPPPRGQQVCGLAKEWRQTLSYKFTLITSIWHVMQIMIYVQRGATVSYWCHFSLLFFCLLLWSAEEKTFQGPLWFTSPAKTCWTLLQTFFAKL